MSIRKRFKSSAHQLFYSDRLLYEKKIPHALVGFSACTSLYELIQVRNRLPTIRATNSTPLLFSICQPHQFVMLSRPRPPHPLILIIPLSQLLCILKTCRAQDMYSSPESLVGLLALSTSRRCLARPHRASVSSVARVLIGQFARVRCP